MARLDVSPIPQDPDFADRFDIMRRPETVDQFGRSVPEQVVGTDVGTLYPTGDNSLVRQSDYELSRKTLTLVTKARLQQAAPGFQPDIVLFRGNRYVVSSVEDYTQYGEGFAVYQLSSVLAIDEPPQ